MSIRVDPGNRTPIYRQIVEQVERRVATGALAPETRLPPVRELALELRINPNTVARAYREMERSGLVVAQQGRGVFIAQRPAPMSRQEQRQRVRQHLDDLLVAAWKVDLQLEDLIEELRRRAATLNTKDEEVAP